MYAGRPQLSIEILDQAERLDPLFSNWHLEACAFALYQLRQYAEAAAAIERMVGIPLYLHRLRAACYAQLDRFDEARAIATEVLEQQPHFTLSRCAMVDPYQSQASLDHLIEGLRKAGFPE
jgi:tetratricopeptide (TPR) repeat protein